VTGVVKLRLLGIADAAVVELDIGHHHELVVIAVLQQHCRRRGVAHKVARIGPGIFGERLAESFDRDFLPQLHEYRRLAHQMAGSYDYSQYLARRSISDSGSQSRTPGHSAASADMKMSSLFNNLYRSTVASRVHSNHTCG
jgi:hypothetical protein